MKVTLTLPEPLVNHLQHEAEHLDLSLDELTVKLLSDTLAHAWAEPLPVLDDETDLPTLEEVVALIRATPPNPKAIHPPTKTIDQVLAELEANPPSEPLLTAEEWDEHWWPVRSEMEFRNLLT